MTGSVRQVYTLTKAKDMAILFQKGFPIDVQQVVTDVNGCYLILCTKMAGIAITG